MSNLKQIAIAAAVYGSENKDYVPPTRYAGYLTGVGENYNTWRTTLTPYLTGQAADDALWSRPFAERDQYNAIWRDIQCPFAEYGLTWNFDGSQMSYGMSCGTSGTYSYDNGIGMQGVGLPLGPFRRQSDATMPSETMSYTDTVMYDYITPTYYTVLGDSLTDLLYPARHPSDDYGTVFLDGHAEATPFEVLSDPDDRLWVFKE